MRLLHRVEVGFEGVEAASPRLPERGEPVVDLHQRLGHQPVEAALGVLAHRDEPGVAQDAQVLGHRRLGQRRASTRSFTGRSPSRSSSRIRRRLGSATTSNVVSHGLEHAVTRHMPVKAWIARSRGCEPRATIPRWAPHRC